MFFFFVCVHSNWCIFKLGMKNCIFKNTHVRVNQPCDKILRRTGPHVTCTFFSFVGPTLETARWKKFYQVKEHSMDTGCVAHVPPALTRVAAVIPFDKWQTWKRQTDISTTNSIMSRGL